MQKKILGIYVLGIFLLVFQISRNEFIEPNPAVIVASSELQQNELPFRVSLRSPGSAHYLFLLNARNNVVMEQKRLREKNPYYYKIDLKKWDLVALDYLEKPIEDIQHCLTRELIDALKLILREAQICESPNIEASPSHIYCGSKYTLPYGILIFEDSIRINLGEKQTSCDFPTVLCGIANNKLVEWARGLLVGIKDLKCTEL